MTVPGPTNGADQEPPAPSIERLLESEPRLLEYVRRLEHRVREGEDRRWALLHILTDMNRLNQRLGRQREAMLHILVDYEQDRHRILRQAERLDDSRRALMHILQDVHQSNERLADGRKAMIHIMGDLRETTEEVQHRERELRYKQEQLVQAGKLAIVGELATGIAHELNNPLNNIGLFVGNAVDHIELGTADQERLLDELRNAMQEVRRATAIISHLRTFGRVAPASREPVLINGVVRRSVSLLYQQLRLLQVEVRLDLCAEDPVVLGNAIQLEQVLINLLTNARDAVANAPRKLIHVESAVREGMVDLVVRDTGPGIPEELEQRIFDPFFTTKEAGAGTGLGLSIAYDIVKDHGGTISIVKGACAGDGATFLIRLPLRTEPAEPAG